MAAKYQLITELYQRTSAGIARNAQAWQGFLASACRNYKCRFDEQVLIYAQRPDATAVAKLETWNTMFRRWVNKDSKGIAVFDPKGRRNTLKYYFDISDTHEGYYGSRPVPIWQMDERYEQAVIERLSDRFGDIEGSDLASALMETAKNAVEDHLPDYLAELKNWRTDSFLEELDDLNLEVSYRRLAENSVAFMLFTRCGLDTELFFEREDFADIVNFNTPATINAIGIATSDIAEMALREISQTIRTVQLEERGQNRTFADPGQSRYDRSRKQPERSDDHERDHLQQGGGLLNLKIVYIYIQPTDTLLADTPQKPNHTEKEFLHMKSIFEQLGGTYHEENGYLIPDLRLPAEKEQPISTWGQRHLHYLKQYRKVTYTNLLICGKLNIYLADIDKQAQERFERLIEDMKRAQGITERLKEENALEWTGRLGNIRACAREIVNEEIIYA